MYCSEIQQQTLIIIVAFYNLCQVIHNNKNVCDDWIEWNDHPRGVQGSKIPKRILRYKYISYHIWLIFVYCDRTSAISGT